MPFFTLVQSNVNCKDAGFLILKLYIFIFVFKVPLHASVTDKSKYKEINKFIVSNIDYNP